MDFNARSRCCKRVSDRALVDHQQNEQHKKDVQLAYTSKAHGSAKVIAGP
jgi:hypothetical protein